MLCLEWLVRCCTGYWFPPYLALVVSPSSVWKYGVVPCVLQLHVAGRLVAARGRCRLGGSLLSSHSLRSLQRVTGRRDQCLRWFSNTRRLGPWRPVNAELAGLCRSGRPCPWLSLCPVTSCFALTSSLLTAVALSSCVCGGLVTPAPPPGGVSTWELLLGRAGLSHSAPLVIHTCIGGFFFK